MGKITRQNPADTDLQVRIETCWRACGAMWCRIFGSQTNPTTFGRNSQLPGHHLSFLLAVLANIFFQTFVGLGKVADQSIKVCSKSWNLWLYGTDGRDGPTCLTPKQIAVKDPWWQPVCVSDGADLEIQRSPRQKGLSFAQNNAKYLEDLSDD